MIAYLAQTKQDLEEVPIVVLGFAWPVLVGLLSSDCGLCDVVEKTFGLSLKGYQHLSISTFSSDLDSSLMRRCRSDRLVKMKNAGNG